MNALRKRALRLFLPSLSDCLFLSLLIWLFGMGGRRVTLLADGDTGWHIRAGEIVLNTRQWLKQDPFSFSKGGEPWFAWEWLADVLFALAWRHLGLKGVVLLAGVVIVAGAVIVFRHALRSGANMFLAMFVCMLATGAASIHYLARPHVFTLLFWAVSLYLLDRDCRQPGRAVWALAPLTALWANLHAAFPALLVSLGVLAAGNALEALRERGAGPARWSRAKRYLALLLACSLASLLNPYGFRLHLHIAGHMKSDWIRNVVDEFQAPRFRSENALYFEILLFAGLMTAALLVSKRKYARAALIVLWAHAALVSERHIPLFAILAAPQVAAQATVLWRQWVEGRPAESVLSILNRVGEDARAGFQRTSFWAPLLVAAMAVVNFPFQWPRDFPHQKFPVSMVSRQGARLAGARVFTSDQWAGYLLFRFHPRMKVFLDGRFDFYGPPLGRQYLQVVEGRREWESVLDRHGFELVLAPVDWPAVSLLGRDPAWRVVDRDPVAVLFERVTPARLKK